MVKEKRLITAALPYVNNFPHLGNIVGSHLPADIFARYCRLAGHETVLIGGTDEHGTATEVAARKEGLSPEELCNKYYKEHVKIYDWFNISYDNFSRTSKKIHHKTTQDFFKEMYKNGFVIEGVLNLPYCKSCKKQLSDRFIEGICPVCGYENARGDQCEKCGSVLEPVDLKEPRCAICGSKDVEFKEFKHLFFDIPKLSDKLKDLIRNNKNLRSQVKNTALAWIKEGLKPRSITRNLEWGIKVPLKGYEDLVFYVWYEAPIGYISSTLEWNKSKGKAYWTDRKTKIYHFVGKDNIVFHTIFWPASIMANGKYNLPFNVVGLQYLNYEGGKTSKSKGYGRAIFCDQIPKYGLDADYWRFYLTYLIPETKDTDFSWTEFEKRVKGDLIDNFSNFVNRTLKFVWGRLDGKINRPKKLDKDFISKVKNQVDNVTKAFEAVELRLALAEILKLSAVGNEYFDRKEPWKNNDEQTLFMCTSLCEILGVVIQPFLPDTSKKILSMLGSKKKDFKNLSKFDAKWFKIKEPSMLFDKKYFEEKMKKVPDIVKTIVDSNQENQGSGGPKMENNFIEFNDWKKLDLRVGTIKKAEPHPSADKLVVLQVDIGEPKDRQVVAGIKNYYKLDSLVGKKVIIFANLKPVNLRGFDSNGMILAAVNNKDVVLLTTDKPINNGARIE